MIFKIKNKLEKAWDEVTWNISMIILILSGGSFFYASMLSYFCPYYCSFRFCQMELKHLVCSPIP